MIENRWYGQNQRQIEFTLKPFLYHLQMKQAKKTTAETKTKCC